MLAETAHHAEKARDRVFIIRLFTGSIVGMIFGLFTGVAVLFLVFAGLLVALAATGGPDSCTPGGGPTVIDASQAAGFQGKWDALTATLDGGAPASTTFTESELSSRADQFLEERDAPLKDPRVCLHDGYGEGTATFAFMGFDAKLKIKGTMKLDGARPEAEIDSITIGSIPGFLTAPAERFVNRALDDVLDDVDLDHKYTPTITEGQVALAGTP
jgi:hypothetical protein